MTMDEKPNPLPRLRRHGRRGLLLIVGMLVLSLTAILNEEGPIGFPVRPVFLPPPAGERLEDANFDLVNSCTDRRSITYEQAKDLRYGNSSGVVLGPLDKNGSYAPIGTPYVWKGNLFWLRSSKVSLSFGVNPYHC